LLDLRLFTRLLETGAVVGLFAIVVIFQPELRRALERIGRVGSMAWILSPADQRNVDLVAAEIARAAHVLSAEGAGALIVIERDTGLEEIAETGVMIHGDLSADLLRSIFAPKTALHDGAVIVRGNVIVAAGTVLPLAETSVQAERFGTRHRAALGITEQTDAVAIVVSEENGQVSLVERARIVRNLNQAQLERALKSLLGSDSGRLGLIGGRSTGTLTRPPSRLLNISELRRAAARRRLGRTPAPERPADDESTGAAARAPR
jgi:diadenylate cyclase